MVLLASSSSGLFDVGVVQMWVVPCSKSLLRVTPRQRYHDVLYEESPPDSTPEQHGEAMREHGEDSLFLGDNIMRPRLFPV